MYLEPRRVFHRIVRAKCSAQVAGGNVHSFVWETCEKGKRTKSKRKTGAGGPGFRGEVEEEKKKKKKKKKKKNKNTTRYI
jgi:hypothetical protein